MTKPDTISVVTKSIEEIEADAAAIYFTVEGSSSFFGEEAFRKAEEVKAVNEALIAAGVEENRIKLRNVNIDSSTFSMLKSSSASYSIKISKVELSLLPAVLGIIGEQKNCTMTRLEWIYGRADEVRAELRADALRRAIQQARKDAVVLGVDLLGIYDLAEDYHQDSVSREYVDDFSLSTKTKRARGRGSIELGVALGNATSVRVTMKAQFRVSAFHTTG